MSSLRVGLAVAWFGDFDFRFSPAFEVFDTLVAAVCRNFCDGVILGEEIEVSAAVTRFLTERSSLNAPALSAAKRFLMPGNATALHVPDAICFSISAISSSRVLVLVLVFVNTFCDDSRRACSSGSRRARCPHETEPVIGDFTSPDGTFLKQFGEGGAVRRFASPSWRKRGIADILRALLGAAELRFPTPGGACPPTAAFVVLSAMFG